jgi:hypothetical protein
MDTKECVVQVVTNAMVEQVNLASTEYASEIDEFVKSGLTPIDSDLVKPKRVKESPFQMECKLLEMKSYGEESASANLAICEVIKFHVDEFIFTKEIIDPKKIDLVGRMSGSNYTRSTLGVFRVEKPIGNKGMGYDKLPEFIMQSSVYTANNLAKLASSESIPTDEEVKEFITSIAQIKFKEFEDSEYAFFNYKKFDDYYRMFKVALSIEKENHAKAKKYIEIAVQCALENNNTDFAWKAALYSGKN